MIQDEAIDARTEPVSGRMNGDLSVTAIVRV
jgi:hypothetical protein